jgi:hypothetical protein
MESLAIVAAVIAVVSLAFNVVVILVALRRVKRLPGRRVV